MQSLLHLSLKALIRTYIALLDSLEVRGVHNGIILTNASDIILKLRGDVKLFMFCYYTHQYDQLFDLILNTHSYIVELESIII